jgi:hypothetical protein
MAAKKKPDSVATTIRVVFAPAMDTPAAQVVINPNGVVIEREGDSIVNTVVVDHSGNFDDVRSDQLKALRDYMKSSSSQFDIDGDLPYRLYAYLVRSLQNNSTGIVDANDPVEEPVVEEPVVEEPVVEEPVVEEPVIEEVVETPDAQ